MTAQKQIDTLKEILKKIAPDKDIEKLNPADGIRKALALDSYDFLQFIIGLDEMFKIKTPEEDYHKLETLQDAADYVNQNIASKNSI
jgi:acyl carrier protein